MFYSAGTDVFAATPVSHANPVLPVETANHKDPHLFPRPGSIQLVRNIMHARARRSEHFKASLFSDPGWDILLELFAAELEGRPLNVSAIGLTAKVPGTTVLRWIGVLETEGLIRRRNDPFDGRRSLVSLTEDGSRALREYFQL